MIKYFTLFLFVFTIQIVFSQDEDSSITAQNTFYVDFSKEGPVYSINYDRIFHQSKKTAFSYRIGFSVLKDAIAFPIGVNFLKGKQNSHLEISLSLIPYIDHYKSFLSSNDLSDKYLYLVPGIGYRYQKPSGGLFFKVLVSPAIFLDPPSDNFWNMEPRLRFLGELAMGYSY